MGQFEYSVDLSPVKPEDIERIAKEYIEEQERNKMIKHEYGMLVLDPALSREDQEAINSFIHEQIKKERQRILSDMESASEDPSYVRITKIKLREILGSMA